MILFSLSMPNTEKALNINDITDNSSIKKYIKLYT